MLVNQPVTSVFLRVASVLLFLETRHFIEIPAHYGVVILEKSHKNKCRNMFCLKYAYQIVLCCI